MDFRKEASKKREVYLDFLRIIAIFMIIYNHTAAFFMVSSDFCYAIPAMLCKMGVPIFFLISGALLLGKQEPIRKLLTKRVLRMTIVLVLISVVAYLFNVIHYKRYEEASIVEFIQQFMTCSIDASYWYLYAYIGFLCCLPLLRPMAQYMNVSSYIYFSILNLLVSIVWPLINDVHYIELTGHLNFPLISNFVWLAVTGYFIRKERIQVSRRKECCIALGVTLGCMLISLVILWAKGKACPENYNILDRFSPIMAACIFIMVKNVDSAIRLKERFAGGGVTTLGSCTFGIYLFQYIFLRITDPICWKLMNTISVFSASVIQMLVIVAAGYILTYILKGIPGVRRLL